MSTNGHGSTASTGDGRSSKSRKQSYIDEMELEAEGERPFRRSRTGCLTCRKRKKKCPEQYDGCSCLRCKAGGWKCVRERGQIASSSSSTPRAKTYTPDPLQSHVQSTGQASQADASVSAHHLSSDHLAPDSLFADFSITETAFASATEHAPAGFHPPIGPEPSQHPSVMVHGQGGASTAPPTDDRAVQPAEEWTLDDLLGADLPDFDMSLYTNFDADITQDYNAAPSFGAGQQHPPFVTPNPFGLSTAQGDERSERPNGGSASGAALWNSAAGVTSTASLTGGKLGPLLETFYDQHILPAWSITYPSPVREAIVTDYHVASNTHQLNRLCRQAAAAAYIKLLQHTYGGQSVSWLRKRKTSVPVPTALFDLDIDAESIIREATLLARNPKDTNMTINSHLLALEDLHMGVGAFCESNRAFAIMDIAEHLLTLAYGPHPAVDLESKYSYLPFSTRAFVMIDINRSLCLRRTTFFNFDEEATVGRIAGHVNDGSHDNWFGLPSTLAVYLARVCNLVAIATQYTTAPVPASICHKATQLEDQIRTYRAPFSLFDPTSPRHPSEYTAGFAIETELWRNLSIILLCRHVMRDSPLSTSMRRHTGLVMDLLKALPFISRPRMERDPRLLDWWSLFYTTHAFIVGSMSVDLAERQFIRGFLQEMGTEKVLEDMLVILEMTWMKTDKQGVVADWYEEARAMGLGVIFF